MTKVCLVLPGACALGLVAVGLLDGPLEAWLRGLRGAGGLALRLLAAVEALPPLVAAGCAVAILAPLAARRLGKAPRPSAMAAAVFLLLSTLGPALIVLPLKHAVGRGRPCCSAGPLHFESFAFVDSFASFPSAQSAIAAGQAVALALVFPRLRGVAVAVALLVGLSRVFAGAHWASDTIVGWGLGAAFGLWLAERRRATDATQPWRSATNP